MIYDLNPSWDGQSYGQKMRVWFTGTGALRRGQAVAWDAENGTAGDSDGDRGYKVVSPSAGTYALHFAGVTDRAYAANAQGQSIDIWLPGSICQVAATVDTTINTGLLNCNISSTAALAGLFYNGGLAGLGAAIPLQTVSANVTGSSVDGSAAVAGTTVTKTGLFAGAAAGDSVAIFASCTSAGAAGATPGVYTISSVTSDDAAELTASAGTGDIAAVVYDPSATVLAKLLTGPDHISGCVKWVTPLNNAAASPAHMVHGVNIVFGGVTLGSGTSTATLADGVFQGQRVGFTCTGTLTTNGYVVTVTTGEKLDGTTNVTTVTYGAAAESVVHEWLAGKWQTLAVTGATFA